MSDLRSKYKGSSIAKLKSKAQEEDSMIGSGGRAGFLSIDEGKNKFRIYPAHENDDWYVMVVKHWITVEKDGKDVRRTVYNAKLHGGFKKDIFEEYIKGASTHLRASDDDEASDKIAIMGDSYKGGLVGSANWLLYADKIKGDKKEFGIVEMNKSTRDGVVKIGSFEDNDEPIQVEPFTDPEEGMPMFVDYNSKAKKAGDKYTVSLGNKPKALPLTDEELEAFDKVKPLGQLYKNVYGMEDLELALEGIRFFDEKHDIGYWDTDEWQEIIEEITAMVKSGKKSSTKDDGKGKSKLASKPVLKSKPKKEDEDEDTDDEDEEEEAEEEEKPIKKAVKKKGDKFDDMDRDELKEFIGEEELNTKCELKVMKSDSDDDIRVKIRKALESLEEEDTEEEETEEEDEEEQPKKKALVKKPIKKDEDDEDEDDDDDSPSLEDIKNKIKKNTGKK